MKLAQDAKIYRRTEVLLQKLTEPNLIENMPKSWRHTIYPQMVKEATEMVSLVYHAYTEMEDRRKYLTKYLGCLEALKALTRLAHIRMMLTHGQFNELDELYEDIGKQATAWRRSAKGSDV